MNADARCRLAPEAGPCRASIASWYYDTTMRKCLPFTYGGCRGNANRFDTEYQCTEVCVIGRGPTDGRGLPTSPTATWYQLTSPSSHRTRE